MHEDSQGQDWALKWKFESRCFVSIIFQVKEAFLRERFTARMVHLGKCILLLLGSFYSFIIRT